MDVKELMRCHVRALFTQDDDGRLIAVNDSSRAQAPRIFLGRTVEGNLWWMRKDVSAQLVEELQALCEALPVVAEFKADDVSLRPFIDSLSREQPVERVWSGPAYECPFDLAPDETAVGITLANSELLSPYLEDWRNDAEAGVPMVASLQDGAAVSVCCSVRVTDLAHEAGVETHPNFRGRGHASRAVAAWATAVRELGSVPLYSTSWDNESSWALARKLGLILFGADLHLT